MNELALFAGYGLVAASTLLALAALLWIASWLCWKMMRRFYNHAGLLRAAVRDAYRRDTDARRLASRVGALGGLLHNDGLKNNDPIRTLAHWRELQECTRQIRELA